MNVKGRIGRKEEREIKRGKKGKIVGNKWRKKGGKVR